MKQWQKTRLIIFIMILVFNGMSIYNYYDKTEDKTPASKLQEVRQLKSRHDTYSDVGQNPNINFEEMSIVPLKNAPDMMCLHAPKNLQVRPIPQEECGSPYVLMNSGGRLGNNLCQYMSLYLLRHLFGVRVSIDKSMHMTLSHILRNMTLPVNDPRCFTNDTKSIDFNNLYVKLYEAAQEARTRRPQDVITEPLLKRSYYVSSHPCPRELFLAHRDLVRHVLAFREDLLQRARDDMDKTLRHYLSQTSLQDKKVTPITVHVRRTDYTGYVLRKFNLKQLDEVYFQRAFDSYRRKVVNPVFVVMSDDREWCHKFLQDRDVIVSDAGGPAVDMAMLSLGNHAVTSYGTFSFIGAALGPGNITHPISDNKIYLLYSCTDSPALHLIQAS